MQYQVLARKWRPRRFTEMVGQEHVLRALTNALNSGRVHHAFLFTGTRGVGKTTLARILAKSLNCETGVSAQPCGQCASCVAIDEGRFVDLIEVDAASRTKVEDTRDLLDNVQYAPTRGRYKVYLIDEVHMLSNHSFNALLKTLEEPPPHVKFLFATTDPQKLPVTILSRCLQFNLKQLYPDLIRGHLERVLQQEGIPFEPTALKRLAKAADGSMRDALSLLDQGIAYGGGKVNDVDIRDMLGTIEQTHIYDLLEALATRNSSQFQLIMARLVERSPDYSEVLAELLSCLHHLALLQHIPNAYDEVMGDQERMLHLTRLLSPEDVQLFYQIGVMGRRDLAFAPSPGLGFEMTLLRMLAFVPQQALQTAPTHVAPTVATSTPPPVPAPLTTKPSDTPLVPSLPAAAANKQPTGPTTVSAGNISDWLGTLNQLKLSPVVREMAMNSVLLGSDTTSVRLMLDGAYKNLLTEERRAQLQMALQQHLAVAARLIIDVGQVSSATPANQLQREQQQRHAAAHSAITTDGNVQKIVETFGAQINLDSIQPID
ncbi:MAG: DNA polymerase III subunit gamma/tau [Gammaproteobacteria bacterium]|nr:DNA polymerase III subunit gamma/tau [Gammaproteobacteria bacterium]